MKHKRPQSWTPPDNARRAKWGEDAVKTNPDDNGAETNTADVLANIMHYCDREGIDFYAALHQAEFHYDAEKNEEGA